MQPAADEIEANILAEFLVCQYLDLFEKQEGPWIEVLVQHEHSERVIDTAVLLLPDWEVKRPEAGSRNFRLRPVGLE
jgi:hypothetical protein